MNRLVSILCFGAAVLAACAAPALAHAMTVDPGSAGVVMATAVAGVSASAALRSEDAAAAAVATTSNRVTLAHIENTIACEQYITSGDIDAATGTTSPQPGVLTIAVLTLQNGFVVTGESACADPANFNRDLGRQIARENAVRKIWGLEGYALRSRLADNASS